MTGGDLRECSCWDCLLEFFGRVFAVFMGARTCGASVRYAIDLRRGSKDRMGLGVG